MKIASVNFNTYSSARKTPAFKAENASMPTENKTGDEAEIENHSKRNYIIGSSIVAALILVFVAVKKGWFSGKKAAQIVEETRQPKPEPKPTPPPEPPPKPDPEPISPTEPPHETKKHSKLPKDKLRAIAKYHKAQNNMRAQVDNVSAKMEEIVNELYPLPPKSLDEMIEIQKDVVARLYKKDN